MNIYNLAKQLIPILFLVASIVGTILFTYLYLIDTVSLTWLVLFPLVGILTILFTVLDKKHEKEQPYTTNQLNNTHPRPLRILDVIFYIGLSILLITLITNEIRSFPYIILLALLAVTITAPVLLSSNKTVIHHALVKTIILFGAASLSIFKIFYWTGRDTWTHAAWNYQLAQEGWLFAGLGKELQTPLYHVAVAVTEILPGLDVRTATIIAVTIPLIILFSLGVFLVARPIIGSQYAVLTVIIADFIGIVPYWSSWGQSTTYACMVFAIMLVPLFKLLSEKRTGYTGRWLVLFVFFVLTIALTHLYSTFILAMYLGGVLLAWFVVDVFLNRKISLIPALSAIGGLAVAGGYAVVTNLSLMLPVFQNGLNKLLGKYETPEEPSTGIDDSVTPPVSDNPLPGIDNSVVPDTGIVDAVASTDFTALIQSCFTVIEPSIWPSLLSGGLRYALLLIPLVLGSLFVAKHCFKPNIHGFKRSMWYLLVPALMIFFLLFVTTFAYPPMTDRPHYYLPIFLGLVLASILWWYVTREGEMKHISRSSLWTILLIVFLVVSLGTLSTMEEKAGLFEDERSTFGHYASEVYGLDTVLGFVPDKSTVYADYEMRFTCRYALKNPELSSVKQKVLDMYTADSEKGYVIFKDSLEKGTTPSYLQYGSSELERKWYSYTVDPEYIPMMDEVTTNVYENGELVVWDLSIPRSYLNTSTTL